MIYFGSLLKFGIKNDNNYKEVLFQAYPSKKRAMQKETLTHFVQNLDLLVIEPDENQRDELVEMLQSTFRFLDATADGNDAISKYKVKRHRLILCNIHVSERNDFVFVKRILKINPEQSIITLTDQQKTKSFYRLLDFGLDQFVPCPFKKRQLFFFIRRACQRLYDQEMVNTWIHVKSVLRMMPNGSFHFKTYEESNRLALTLSLLFPNQQKAITGLQELFNNAIEHGNLEISYEEKTELIRNEQLSNEVERRHQLKPYRNRIVKVSFRRTNEWIEVIIKDEGNGFNFERFLEIDKNRILDPHGRGIAMARLTLFDDLTYIGNGNTVKVVSYYQNQS